MKRAATSLKGRTMSASKRMTPEKRCGAVLAHRRREHGNPNVQKGSRSENDSRHAARSQIVLALDLDAEEIVEYALDAGTCAIERRALTVPPSCPLAPQMRIIASPTCELQLGTTQNVNSPLKKRRTLVRRAKEPPDLPPAPAHTTHSVRCDTHGVSLCGNRSPSPRRCSARTSVDCDR